MNSQIQTDTRHILERFHSDEIVKYLLEQITRVYSLSKPYITVDLETLEIRHHLEINTESLSYWKNQFDNYIKVYYPELSASKD